MTGKMSRKGFFATMAAVIGGAGAATGAKAVGGVDRYAVVPVPRKYTMAMGAANVGSTITADQIMCSSITVQNINPQEIARQVAASLRRHGLTL